MRVLVIEDEPQLLAQLQQALEQQQFVVDTASDGREGEWMACEFPLDVAIIDLGLPEKSGLEVIEALRAKGCDYPVMILTARDRWQDKVTGLEAGADDYLAKPFHMEELMARLRALIRRSGRWSQSDLESGPVRLNTMDQIVELEGAALALTAYEYRLLEYLILHAGEVLSKSKLTAHIYAEDDERDSNVIEVFIRRLRRKLDPAGSLNPIETLRGRGYRWRLDRTTAA
ncbi:MAG TPA: response regulator transcription factor [Gammaproteobacteria bacterium]|nr:response regulator transcription factor [Gammaproteobacteria bacterium]